MSEYFYTHTKWTPMKTGKDGEYHYVELNREEIAKLMEIVKEKCTSLEAQEISLL